MVFIFFLWNLGVHTKDSNDYILYLLRKNNCDKEMLRL